MPFPVLVAALKQLIPIGFSSAPIVLDLKSIAPVGSDWYFRNGYTNIGQAISGGLSAWSGESVDRNTALQHSVVWACNRIISESIGYIPAFLMQSKDGVKRDMTEHPMYAAMKYEPNEDISAQTFRETLTSHCLLSGGAFAKIARRSGTGVALELEPILPENVTCSREKGGQHRLVYDISTGSGSPTTYTIERGKPHPIFHMRGMGWDGVRGYDVITMGKQSIGTALAGEHNVARFWANGGRVPYVLESDKKFVDDTAFDKYRADWRKMASQPHEVPILELGIKYKQMGLSMVDAQANEFRQFSIPEICRWFSVSPHLVADLTHATFSNIEHLALDFVKMTLSTWLTRWEQDWRRCVLTPEEKSSNCFLKHNVNALLRGDFKTRMEGYSSALQNGHLNIDEVRDLEDRNRLPGNGGQSYHFQMNMQTVPGTGEPTIVEQNMITRQTASAAKPAVPNAAAGDPK